MFSPLSPSSDLKVPSLRRRRRRQLDWCQNSNRLKQQVCTCITLFCTFLDYDRVMKSFPRESERERVLSPFPLYSSLVFFLREFLSWALLSERLEQANLFKKFKASYFFLNSYIWCFLVEKSNLRVQRNNTLNLECKEVRDQFLENLGFPIRQYPQAAQT